MNDFNKWVYIIFEILVYNPNNFLKVKPFTDILK
jgi:hypothetical protein